MKKIIVLFGLSFMLFSCTPNYGKEYGYKRCIIDYSNAICLDDDDEPVPQIEFVALVDGLDSIAVKLKGKEPNTFFIDKKTFAFDWEEEYSFFEKNSNFYIHDGSKSIVFGLLCDKEVVEDMYCKSENIDKIYRIGDGNAMYLLIEGYSFLYPLDAKKFKKEKAYYEKYNKAKKNNYFQ